MVVDRAIIKVGNKKINHKMNRIKNKKMVKETDKRTGKIMIIKIQMVDKSKEMTIAYGKKPLEKNKKVKEKNKAKMQKNKNKAKHKVKNK